MSYDGEKGGRLLSPHALDPFLRHQTPLWVSQLLKIKLGEVSLEDLFANCWIL